jgi:hypothetical protein
MRYVDRVPGVEAQLGGWLGVVCWVQGGKSGKSAVEVEVRGLSFQPNSRTVRLKLRFLMGCLLAWPTHWRCRQRVAAQSPTLGPTL